MYCTFFYLTAGLLLLLAGWLFIAKINLVTQFARILRENLLNESRLVLEKKKWAFFFLLTGIFLLYLGLARL